MYVMIRKKLQIFKNLLPKTLPPQAQEIAENRNLRILFSTLEHLETREQVILFEILVYFITKSTIAPSVVDALRNYMHTESVLFEFLIHEFWTGTKMLFKSTFLTLLNCTLQSLELTDVREALRQELYAHGINLERLENFKKSFPDRDLSLQIDKFVNQAKQDAEIKPTSASLVEEISRLKRQLVTLNSEDKKKTAMIVQFQNQLLSEDQKKRIFQVFWQNQKKKTETFRKTQN